MNSKTTIFLHIPKAAGTTLNHLVHRNYKSKQIFAAPETVMSIYGKKWREVPSIERWRVAQENFAKLPVEDKRNKYAIYGHMWFGWHELTPVDCQYVTFLRDPVERTISHFNFLKDLQGSPISEEINKHQLNLTDFLDKKDDLFEKFSGVNLLDNIQTKLISGDIQLTEYSWHKAINNIKNNFLFIGFAESFNKDILTLAKLLKWNLPFYSTKNVSQKYVSPYAVDEECIYKIVNSNFMDIALYKYIYYHFKSEHTDNKIDNIKTMYFEALNDFIGQILINNFDSLKKFWKRYLNKF